MLRIFLTKAAPMAGLSLLATLALSGCGKGDSSGGPGSGGPGGVGSVVNGATIIPTPYGNALSYQFTATAVQPTAPLSGQTTRRFLAGVLPFGQQPSGGSCGSNYNYGTEYLSFCNRRSSQFLMRNSFYDQPVFGNATGFGVVTPSVASWFSTTTGSYGQGQSVVQRPIRGYEYDGISMVTIGATQQSGVSCPAVYQQQGITTCTQTTLSGVMNLSPSFIQENLPGAAISHLAFDVSLTGLSGTIFIISPTAGGSTIAIF